MGICKIQKPQISRENKHGQIIIQITCNDEKDDEIKFDATKGDLKLHLICEEEEGNILFIKDEK